MHKILLEEESSDMASNTTDGRELYVVSSLIQKVNVEDFGTTAPGQNSPTP
jgi:hypothetical protein